MSEMQADLLGVLNAASAITRDLHELRTFADSALWELSSPLNVPAPLTEDAIVAALGNDATMAGRVIARLAVRWSTVERANAAAGAKNQVSDFSDPGARCLQSLAVALAAASYRG